MAQLERVRWPLYRLSGRNGSCSWSNLRMRCWCWLRNTRVSPRTLAKTIKTLAKTIVLLNKNRALLRDICHLMWGIWGFCHDAGHFVRRCLQFVVSGDISGYGFIPWALSYKQKVSKEIVGFEFLNKYPQQYRGDSTVSPWNWISSLAYLSIFLHSFS